jgi:hypothetical protein
MLGHLEIRDDSIFHLAGTWQVKIAYQQRKYMQDHEEAHITVQLA